jgi:hypothetical protein
MRLIPAVLILGLASFHGGVWADACDAKIIMALKNTTSINESKVVKDELYKTVCSSSDQSFSFGYKQATGDWRRKVRQLH